MRPLDPLHALSVAFGALRDDLAPGSAASEEHRAALHGQLRQLAAAWPFACASSSSSRRTSERIASIAVWRGGAARNSSLKISSEIVPV